MSVSEDAVTEKLKNVIDPELFVNIVDLGLIYEIKIGADAIGPSPVTEAAADTGDAPVSNDVTNDDKSDDKGPVSNEAAPAEEASEVDGEPVLIEMTMTSPACPAGPQLIGGARKEVSSIDGVGSVEVKIVLDPPWTPDRMTEDAKDQLGIF